MCCDPPYYHQVEIPEIESIHDYILEVFGRRFNGLAVMGDKSGDEDDMNVDEEGCVALGKGGRGADKAWSIHLGT